MSGQHGTYAGAGGDRGLDRDCMVVTGRGGEKRVCAMGRGTGLGR